MNDLNSSALVGTRIQSFKVLHFALSTNCMIVPNEKTLLTNGRYSYVLLDYLSFNPNWLYAKYFKLLKKLDFKSRNS